MQKILREQQEVIGTSDYEPQPSCKYSAAKLPCLVKAGPESGNCRECLRSQIEQETGICDFCGADKKVYLETMHRPCSAEHGIGSKR